MGARTSADGAGPLPDVVDEAVRLVAVAEREDAGARLLGGTAIQLVARAAGVSLFERAPQDIDLVTPRGAGPAVEQALPSCGYRPDEMFNALNGHRRLLFFDDAHGRQVDVFIGQFAMCHEIPLGDRLALPGPALACAELLMMKLQIVELNAKDQADIFALLLSAEVADRDDGPAVNGRYVAETCAADWGLWRTLTMNLERTRAAASALDVPAPARHVIEDRVSRLEAFLDAAPKSRRWKLRARVGDRVRWYEEPEEVS